MQLYQVSSARSPKRYIFINQPCPVCRRLRSLQTPSWLEKMELLLIHKLNEVFQRQHVYTCGHMVGPSRISSQNSGVHHAL